ncbi:MAG: hypothetical protein WBD16_10280 [Pyrinomonadaceae bacterium]
MRQFERWAKRHCAPIYWVGDDGKPHNGTITFLKTSSKILGLTNKHVADALVESSFEAQSTMKLGSAPFDPKYFISKHPDLDLATFEIPSVYLPLVGLSQSHEACTVTEWPPRLPGENDILVLAGYPDRYRLGVVNEAEEFKLAWIAGKINEKPGRNISMLLGIETGTSIDEDRIEPNAPLNGISGGPVFRYVDAHNIERLELTGVVHSTDFSSCIALAHPLISLNEDGSFSTERW